MTDRKFRTERDSMGSVRVPKAALWGAQTQRAVENFDVSGLTMPRPFIVALALVKSVAAQVNADLGLIDKVRGDAIRRAADQIADGLHESQFPIDVFQTGSGTSSNMNANEVIARLAAIDCGLPVHPNDHVNLGQSSNDTIPTAIHVAACMQVQSALRPALVHLVEIIQARATELDGVIKTGRTHLMDATPLRFGQELSGWGQQIRNGAARLDSVMPRLLRLAQGGTAVGTGLNAHPRFARAFSGALAKRTGLRFEPSPNLFESLSSVDACCELSGQLKVIACSLMKISNDLRLMNSGPLAGIGEIELPALQPGSSIMPGKVNPVIPECVCMVAAKVIGNDASMTVAAQSGTFQLNVMLPLVAYDLLQSIGLLAHASRLLADKAIAGFTVRGDRIEQAVARSPMLVTALNSVIGYEQGAAIAKRAYSEGRSILDVAAESTKISKTRLRRLLDPKRLTGR
jgi:fumarate hydratase class II